MAGQTPASRGEGNFCQFVDRAETQGIGVGIHKDNMQLHEKLFFSAKPDSVSERRSYNRSR